MRHLLAVLLLCTLCRVGLGQQDRQLIAVATYQIESQEMADRFDGMMVGAISALNDFGIKQIGVFKLAEPKDGEHTRIVITPYDRAEQFVNQGEAFQGNGEFWNVAQDYLLTEPDNPPFKRIDTVLLRAFSGMPKLAVPGSADGKQRLFELRTYESYNELTGLIKVEMFNDGEIELFDKVGLPGVFYGRAIVGKNLPQLTYMLVHDDTEAQKAGWQKFIRSPEWAALQKKEPYVGKKLVSKIVKTMLVATDYSQVK